MAFVQFGFSQSLRLGCSAPGCFVDSFRLALLTIAGVLLATLLSTASSWAAIVTTNETELDSIFSQPSFGATPVDIRFLPTITLVNPSLLDIDNSAEFYNLVGQFNSSTIHYAYFVDSIDWCGESNPAIVGCAFQPGNDLVIESGFAAGANGAELIAHELAHNLSLEHDELPAGNLLDPTINGNTTLTASQASAILSRPSVQTDLLGNRFVQIQPVLIAASLAVPVPEPSTALLAASLLGIFASSTRRWRV